MSDPEDLSALMRAARKGDDEAYRRLLLPLTWTVQDLPRLELDEQQACSAVYGQKFEVEHDDGTVQLWHGGQFLGIADITVGTLRPRRMVRQPDLAK